MAGTAVLLVLAVALALSLSPATRAAAPWLIYGLFAIIALTVMLFAALTVEVDAKEIRVKFGIGLVRKSMAVGDVVRCERLRTRIWWGWGLHWTPSGWLYNVGGREAVRVILAHERPVIIGSDEAERLKAAIDARIAARQR
jgi:uncharacterized membrane protein YbhN (UPF0104 family)